MENQANIANDIGRVRWYLPAHLTKGHEFNLQITLFLPPWNLSLFFTSWYIHIDLSFLCLCIYSYNLSKSLTTLPNLQDPEVPLLKLFMFDSCILSSFIILSSNWLACKYFLPLTFSHRNWILFEEFLFSASWVSNQLYF